MKRDYRTGGIGTSFAMVTGVPRPSPFAGHRTWDGRGTALALGARASTKRVHNYHEGELR